MMIRFQYVREFNRVMAFMKPRAWIYGIGIVGNNVSAALGLNIAMAFIYMDMVNGAVEADMRLLARSVILALAVLAVSSFLCTFLTYMYNKCVRHTMTEIRQISFRHVERLPLAAFERSHSGGMLSRLTNDLNHIEHLYDGAIGGMIYALVVGIGAAVAMFALNWKLAVYAIVLGGVTFLVNTCFAGRFRSMNDDIQRALGRKTELLSDLLSGVQLVKMFQLGAAITGKYDAANREIAALSTKVNRKYALLDGINTILGSMSFIGIVIIGGMMALNDRTDFGTIMAFIKLQGNIGAMFFKAGDLVTDLQRVLAGASRVFEVLDKPVEPERYQSPPARCTDSALEMKDVAFQYEGGKEVLRGLSLTIGKGECAALVGLSGSGKSTIVKLLLGFYPAGSGSMSLLGKPMGAYRLSEIRGLIAYVPQDAFLFDGTIGENIGYGNPRASQADIIAAAKDAHAHDFIMNQPQGYSTAIGERGVRLSGGQKQRIAIARAFLKDAPILLLDEATSALDTESEAIVQGALNQLMQGRTVIMIAHRLSTIERADRIYVVDNGTVLEHGGHEELMGQQSLYKQLYQLQTGDRAG
ncbi:ABC transporter ATP-binding protein/permease [Paenibacillus oenotherae]|uniref:ABC transporter ATP-binding protein/permease n=1 Tax=Paenibacillus oenotherae TaxID=1435645 RepID=A0ABS7DC72_9BACL|nr:ABC transporter ATP-binding protein [Paenibacillus oenotherae]MBW7477343.1 ABC transporter ATP-binding protein/permease [Paenibacillus oenotherae]